MTEIDVTEVLRPGLLEGVAIVLADAERAGSPATAARRGVNSAAIRATCAALAGVVYDCPLTCSGEPEADDAQVEGALAATVPGGPGGVQMLVVDAGGLFALLAQEPRSHGDAAGAPTGARADALIATLEASWRVTRAVATPSFIPGAAGGRIVYLAPASTYGPGSPSAPAGETHAEATRAGLENLARTLSIEWARYGITPVAIAPGPRTTPAELAGVVAYLASPAGAYFSGCLLDLRGPG
jgi:citronellol/citronellal dehydrogenase